MVGERPHRTTIDDHTIDPFAVFEHRYADQGSSRVATRNVSACVRFNCDIGNSGGLLCLKRFHQSRSMIDAECTFSALIDLSWQGRPNVAIDFRTSTTDRMALSSMVSRHRLSYMRVLDSVPTSRETTS